MIIRLKDLTIEASIGIYAHEKRSKQQVYVQVKLEFDGKSAAASDDIAKTLDYEALSLQIEKFTKSRHFNLVESLVDGILKIVMSDKRVLRAAVEVDKPNALKTCRSVSVSSMATRI